MILNEIEASRSAGLEARRPDGTLDTAALAAAVERLYESGNMEFVAVHMPEGVYVRERNGQRFWQGSLEVPQAFIQGKLGAGDAFCAGFLFAIHEGKSLQEAAHFGTCAATACLAHSSATEGLRPAAELLELARSFPQRRPPVE